MSSTPAGLEGLIEKVNVGLRPELEPFCAPALRANVVPNCMEKLGLGLRVILTGKGEGPGGFPPPQAGKSRDKKIAANSHADEPKRNLPMHPLVAHGSFRWATRSMEWKTVSVEAGDGFSKLALRTC
jgi:hypothetical protein